MSSFYQMDRTFFHVPFPSRFKIRSFCGTMSLLHKLLIVGDFNSYNNPTQIRQWDFLMTVFKNGGFIDKLQATVGLFFRSTCYRWLIHIRSEWQKINENLLFVFSLHTAECMFKKIKWKICNQYFENNFIEGSNGPDRNTVGMLDVCQSILQWCEGIYCPVNIVRWLNIVHH